ncbi:C-C motif chemokine 22 [Otolemur garnettii]|uniref:C-C motif chemokine 22 n=1 Tax=Otolemur garnettii TaxID=30611 RepID=UPI000274105C|nr:C-C motif chemokine 22 [Otolemur garnettii]
MARLQISLLMALVLLMVALQTTEAGPYGANVEDSICCRDYLQRPLPWRMVQSFYPTSKSCRRRGVVLVTTRNREICADPWLPWVKKIIKRLD